MMGGGDINMHITVQVEAKDGVSVEDARKQGNAYASQFKTQMIQTMQEQMRPGGILYR